VTTIEVEVVSQQVAHAQIVDLLESEAAAALVELEQKFELDAEVAKAAVAVSAEHAARVRTKIDLFDQRMSTLSTFPDDFVTSNRVQEPVMQGNTTIVSSMAAIFAQDSSTWSSGRLLFMLEEMLQQIIRTSFRDWVYGALFLASEVAACNVAAGNVAGALRDARADKVKLVQRADLQELQLRQTSLAISAGADMQDHLSSVAMKAPTSSRSQVQQLTVLRDDLDACRKSLPQAEQQNTHCFEAAQRNVLHLMFRRRELAANSQAYLAKPIAANGPAICEEVPHELPLQIAAMWQPLGDLAAIAAEGDDKTQDVASSLRYLQRPIEASLKLEQRRLAEYTAAAVAAKHTLGLLQARGERAALIEAQRQMDEALRIVAEAEIAVTSLASQLHTWHQSISSVQYSFVHELLEVDDVSTLTEARSVIHELQADPPWLDPDHSPVGGDAPS